MKVTGQITITIIAVIIIGALWYMTSRNLLPWTESASSQWQAVFLSNGQVYFGKVADEDAQLITLRDIYYLQVQSETAAATPDPNQPQVSLVKLGNELHGPVDAMRINRDHVLFIETMKNDAKVVEAIERYIKDGPTPSSSPSILISPTP